MWRKCCGSGVVLLAVFMDASCHAANDNPRIPREPVHRAASVECVSLLGRPLHAHTGGTQTQKLIADLAAARDALAEDPTDPDRIVWVGRRLG